VGAAAGSRGNAVGGSGANVASGGPNRRTHWSRTGTPGAAAGSVPLHPGGRRERGGVSGGHGRFQAGRARGGKLPPLGPGRAAARQRRQGRQREKGCQEQAGEERHWRSQVVAREHSSNLLPQLCRVKALAIARCGRRPPRRSSWGRCAAGTPCFTASPPPFSRHAGRLSGAGPARHAASRRRGRPFAFLVRRCYTPPVESTGAPVSEHRLRPARRDRRDVSGPSEAAAHHPTTGRRPIPRTGSGRFTDGQLDFRWNGA
jgi:hypothetical protein